MSTSQASPPVRLACPRCAWIAHGRFAEDYDEAVGDLYPHLRTWHGMDRETADAALAGVRRRYLRSVDSQGSPT